MERDKLAKEIIKISQIKGHFTLRSGKTSNEYFDKYLFESDPFILAAIAHHISELIPQGTEVLAGLEMGGIPIATAISLKTNIPCAFVRKKAKEYGTCKLAEGAEIKNKKVVIIEDVVTSGGAVLDAVKELRKLDALIDVVFCVIDREENGKENLEQEGLKLLSLFTKSTLING